MKPLLLLLAISCAGCVQMLDTNGLTKDQRREYNDIQLYRLRQKAAREGEVLASLAHGIGQGIGAGLSAFTGNGGAK